MTGDKNPFSCKRDGALNVVFQVPEDLEPTDVNAETGWYIRARITEVENAFSLCQRWVLPFVKGAGFSWQYAEGVRAHTVTAENNGTRRTVEEAERIGQLELAVLRPMEPGFQAMYLRFDRSPHAMPLSLRFQMAGRARMEDALLWEWWDGSRFQPVRCVDGTENLLHSGEVFLYLSQPLPRGELMGREGCWLRVSRTSRRPGPSPTASAILRNTVTAVQRQREPEQYFDTAAYEAGKTVAVLARPVQDCQVWVDEMTGLSAEAALSMAQADPENVSLERNGHDPVRCWVRWRQIPDLALAGPEDRCYTLDPLSGPDPLRRRAAGQGPAHGRPQHPRDLCQRRRHPRQRAGGAGQRPAGRTAPHRGSHQPDAHERRHRPPGLGGDRGAGQPPPEDPGPGRRPAGL